MIHWMIKDGDGEYCKTHPVHSFFRNLSQLCDEGFDQPFWFGLPHEAFAAFLAHANIDPEGVNLQNRASVMKTVVQTPLPEALKEVLKGAILETHPMIGRFHIEVLLHAPGESRFSLPWDPVCELSAMGLEGLYQGIKACWRSLFCESVFRELNKRNLNYSQMRVSLFVREFQEENIRGRSFSYSPRTPWDRSQMVLAFENEYQEKAYLVERSRLRVQYYGKSSELLHTAARPLQRSKSIGEESFTWPEEKIRPLVEFLVSCESKLHRALQMDWILTKDDRLILRRLDEFERAPASAVLDPQNNTNVRHYWDQGLLGWEPGDLLAPFWFSLIPRNFRTLAIRYSGFFKVRKKLTGDYEKVFRGVVGILRGRPYLNLGALHRFLALGGHQDLLEELEVLIPQWAERYDRESKKKWDSTWPPLPQFSKSETKDLLAQQKKLIKKFPQNMQKWIEQIHGLREALASQQWKEKNVSTMLETYQTWERKYLSGLIPILVAELQYWNLRSWYHQMAMPHSSNPSWQETSKREPLTIQGSWFERRAVEKTYLQMEMLREMRPKYLAVLKEVFEMLRRHFELMGQKYQAMGQLERPQDLFYLTLEEIIAFEEGRSAMTQWSALVQVRRNEYEVYARDEKVPEVWMTTGLIGLAARYPRIIAIRDRYNTLLSPLESVVAPQAVESMGGNENSRSEVSDLLSPGHGALQGGASPEDLRARELVQESKRQRMREILSKRGKGSLHTQGVPGPIRGLGTVEFMEDSRSTATGADDPSVAEDGAGNRSPKGEGSQGQAL